LGSIGILDRVNDVGARTAVPMGPSQNERFHGWHLGTMPNDILKIYGLGWKALSL